MDLKRTLIKDRTFKRFKLKNRTYSINQREKLKRKKWTQNSKLKLFDSQISSKLKGWMKMNPKSQVIFFIKIIFGQYIATKNQLKKRLIKVLVME